MTTFLVLLLALSQLASPAGARAALPSSYGELARRWATFDGGNCTSFVSLYADGAVEHEPGNQSYTGAGVLREWCEEFKQTYPGLNTVVDFVAPVNFSDHFIVGLSYWSSVVDASGQYLTVHGNAVLSPSGTPETGLRLGAVRNFYSPPSNSSTPRSAPRADPPAALARTVEAYITYADFDCVAFGEVLAEDAVLYEPPNAFGEPVTQKGRAAAVAACSDFVDKQHAKNDASFITNLHAEAAPGGGYVALADNYQVATVGGASVHLRQFSLLKVTSNGGAVVSAHDLDCPQPGACPP